MADSPGLFVLKSAFTRTLTINHAQVPSTQTDFPVLVNFTDQTFKTEANGGHVKASNAFTFSSDPDGVNLLKWEIDRYNAGTGEIVAWVKIASVSSASDTVFYLRYGSSITTDQSDPVNVWTNSFLGVYHLSDGTTLNVNSSTGVNNGTNNSGIATAGQIDGGVSVSSTANVNLGTGMNPTALTYSAWLNPTGLSNSYNSVVNRDNVGSTVYTRLLIKSNGKLACYVIATASVNYDGTGSNTLLTGTWYYLALTYSSAAGLVGYVNGGSDGTGAANGALNTTAVATAIGIDPNVPGNDIAAKIDEVRVSSVARSADWLTCEYNNQKTSQTFVTLGSET